MAVAGRRATAAVAAAAALGAAAFGWSGVGAAVDAAIYDQFATRLGPAPPPRAVIVAIDEPSFADLGLPWPWPRGLHAALVDSLRAAGAEAVVFDVLFADPTNTAQDGALVAAMGPDVALGADLVVAETPAGVLTTAVEPLPALTAAGARRGLVGVPVDADGAMRALPEAAGSLAGAALAALGEPVPAPPPGARVAFPRPPGAYPRVSYYQALDAAALLPPRFFEGRVAVVGYMLRATADAGGPELFRTPWTARGFGLSAGVEVQAQIIDTLSARAWIAPAPVWAPPTLAAFAAVAVAFMARRREAAVAAAVTIGGAALWLGTSAAGVALAVWTPPAAPALAALLAGAGQAALDFARERAARRRVTRAFEHYLAPAMVARLARDPDALRLGGELRRVTVMFCDLRGFTTLAEAMKDDPEGLTRLVNRALGPIVAAVHAHDGAVDKFIGDCVMGVWNAPADTPDHAARGVAAAVAVVAAIARLSAAVDAEAMAAGRPPPRLAVGVGVNTGACVVGNMGAEGRFDYTAIGDAVNLAARLEALTRSLGLDALIGEDAAAEATGAALVEVDAVVVKGRATPTRLFTPLALWGGAGAAEAATQARALAAYRARDWDGAQAGWRALAADCPAAAPYASLMATRAAAFAAAPPPPDWAGAWTALSK